MYPCLLNCSSCNDIRPGSQIVYASRLNTSGAASKSSCRACLCDGPHVPGGSPAAEQLPLKWGCRLTSGESGESVGQPGRLQRHFGAHALTWRSSSAPSIGKSTRHAHSPTVVCKAKPSFIRHQKERDCLASLVRSSCPSHNAVALQLP